jgi:uncharacterized peroxidase-related enzyme
MAFIETAAESAVAEHARPMYERQRAHYGYVPNYAKVFCHRPEVMERWAALLSAIKRPMDKRRFELATFAAAHTLRSTLCTLAHGKALTEFFPAEDIRELAAGGTPASLTAAEVELVKFARQVALDASAVTAADVARLRSHGFSEGEIFDIVATAAGRAFFTKVIESLGVEADAPFLAMDDALVEALAVGRPIDFGRRGTPARRSDIPACS